MFRVLRWVTCAPRLKKLDHFGNWGFPAASAVFRPTLYDPPSYPSNVYKRLFPRIKAAVV